MTQGKRLSELTPDAKRELLRKFAARRKSAVDPRPRHRNGEATTSRPNGDALAAGNEISQSYYDFSMFPEYQQVNIFQNYRGTHDDWPDFIAELMDREGVTDLLLLGEQRYYHRMAIEAAQQRGIVVAVTDFGYLRPDWITLERDGMSGESLFPRERDKILELAWQVPEPDLTRQFEDSFWRMALWDIVYHLSSTFFWFAFPHYQSHQVYHPIPVYVGTAARILLRRFRGPRADRLIARFRKAGKLLDKAPAEGSRSETFDT